jgi:methylase of polypeptide subunit release factors
MIILLHRIYFRMIGVVRSSRSLTYLLFGFRPTGKNYGEHWDWTALALKQCLRKYYKTGMKLLDMGTGPYGTLAMYVSNVLHGAQVAGCDYHEELVEYARLQPPTGRVRFLCSDLFQNVQETYDLIVFNTPYLDNSFGRKTGVLTDELSISRLTGGLGTIRRFLTDVSAHLSPGGLCLIGVNHFHMATYSLAACIATIHSIRLIDSVQNTLTRSCVYVFIKDA